MDAKKTHDVDQYEQKRLDWLSEVKSVGTVILLPELSPMVADYSYDEPEFHWYTRRRGARSHWCSCEYKDTIIHLIQYAQGWCFSITGVRSITGMDFLKMEQWGRGYPFYSSGWREACALAQTVAQHMNKHRNTNIDCLIQSDRGVGLIGWPNPAANDMIDNDDPDFPFAHLGSNNK